MNMELDSLIQNIINKDGIEKAYIEIKINPIIKKQNTGEYDRVYNPIRERVIDEEEIQDLLNKEWAYSSNIDSHGDYRTEDRLTRKFTIEE